MPEMVGGCQCGMVRYEVAGEPLRVVACHCTACQQQSGSAFGMAVVVNEDDFLLVRGEVNTFTSTSDAGRPKLGAFCPNCGTRIYHKSGARVGKISIRAGTLDDTSWLSPVMHIWTSQKQPWVIIPEGVEVHPTQPS